MEERGDGGGVSYSSGDVLVDIFSVTISSDCTAAMSSSTGVTTKRYYYHVNHLGSVIGLTDNSGNVLQTYAYDSFGKAYVVSGSGIITAIDSNTNLYGNTRLYTGREYDREINLYFLRARYYDASTGKFISRDPIGQKDQVNLYTYVSNTPLNYVDLLGLAKALIFVGVDKPNLNLLVMEVPFGTLEKVYQIQRQKYIAMGYKPENIKRVNGANIDDLNTAISEGNYKALA